MLRKHRIDIHENRHLFNRYRRRRRRQRAYECLLFESRVRARALARKSYTHSTLDLF